MSKICQLLLLAIQVTACVDIESGRWSDSLWERGRFYLGFEEKYKDLAPLLTSTLSPPQIESPASQAVVRSSSTEFTKANLDFFLTAVERKGYPVDIKPGDIKKILEIELDDPEFTDIPDHSDLKDSFRCKDYRQAAEIVAKLKEEVLKEEAGSANRKNTEKVIEIAEKWMKKIELKNACIEFYNGQMLSKYQVTTVFDSEVGGLIPWAWSKCSRRSEEENIKDFLSKLLDKKEIHSKLLEDEIAQKLAMLWCLRYTGVSFDIFVKHVALPTAENGATESESSKEKNRLTTEENKLKFALLILLVYKMSERQLRMLLNNEGVRNFKFGGFQLLIWLTYFSANKNECEGLITAVGLKKEEKKALVTGVRQLEKALQRHLARGLSLDEEGGDYGAERIGPSEVEPVRAEASATITSFEPTTEEQSEIFFALKTIARIHPRELKVCPGISTEVLLVADVMEEGDLLHTLTQKLHFQMANVIKLKPHVDIHDSEKVKAIEEFCEKRESPEVATGRFDFMWSIFIIVALVGCFVWAQVSMAGIFVCLGLVVLMMLLVRFFPDFSWKRKTHRDKRYFIAGIVLRILLIGVVILVLRSTDGLPARLLASAVSQTATALSDLFQR